MRKPLTLQIRIKEQGKKSFGKYPSIVGLLTIEKRKDIVMLRTKKEDKYLYNFENMMFYYKNSERYFLQTLCRCWGSGIYWVFALAGGKNTYVFWGGEINGENNYFIRFRNLTFEERNFSKDGKYVLVQRKKVGVAPFLQSIIPVGGRHTLF